MLSKEVLIVGLAAAGGDFLVRKFGDTLEAQFAKMHIPPILGHATVVGAFTVVTFLIVRAVL